MLEVSASASEVNEGGYVKRGSKEVAAELKRGSKEVCLKRGSKEINLAPVETPEEREKRLKAEQKAKERQEKHAAAMAYVNKNKLDTTVQTLVNRVLNHQPKDPYSALVKHFSMYSKDRPRFAILRARPDGHGKILLTVDARIRGAVVQTHSAPLHKELAAKLQGKRPGEGEDEATVDHAASLSTCAKIQDALGKVFTNIDVTDFRNQQVALNEGVSALQAKYGEEALPSQGIIDEFAGLLLDAEGKLMDLSAHRAMKSQFVRKKLKVSPRMQIASDFQQWDSHWPEIVLPVFEGTGKIKHRISVGFTLWAATLPDVAPKEEGAESGYPTLELVAPPKPENPDADPEDPGAPEIADYCPPTNSIGLLAQLGSAVVAEATAGGTGMPGNDDLGAGAKKLQAAIASKLPKFVEAEQKLLKMQAAAEDTMDHIEHTLNEQHQHKCVYGVVFPDAQGAYVGDRPGYYDFRGDPENAMNADDLIDMYVQLFESNPFLTVLCRPFCTKDRNRFENLSKLRLRLPTYVVLIGDHGPLQPGKQGEIRSRPAGAPSPGMSRDPSQAKLSSNPSQSQFNAMSGAQPTSTDKTSGVEPEAVGVGEDGLPTFRERPVSTMSDGPLARPESAEGAGYDDARTSWPDGTGFLRDCIGLHPLGIAATYEHFSWAFSAKPGLYNLSEQDFPCILPFVDVSLALPETKRMFLLPRLDPEGLQAALEPVKIRLGAIMQQMYRNGEVTDHDAMPKGISLTEWMAGLEKLGYQGFEENGEALFHFLDRGNNNVISENEISVLETVDGPASLKEVDNLRIFLVSNLEKLAGKTAEEAQIESPIKLLWKHMDRNGSGSTSFAEFKKVLEKMKFESDRILQLFMCLDLKNNGVIDEGEWTLLGVLSSNFQLERVDRIRDFIMDNFGSMPKAYKVMDKNKSGALSADEWKEVMEGEYEYEDLDDVQATFAFLDKDCSNVISSREFQFLAHFNRDDFMNEIRKFAEHLVQKYESIELAFDDFEANGSRAKSRPTTAGQPPGTGESRRSEFTSYLEPKDFIEGYKRSGFSGAYDPRCIFNFLDCSRNIHVSRLEFRLLEQLDAVEKMNASAKFMTHAIATLKHWAVENYPGDHDKDSWARTYAAILEAARHDD